MAIFGQGGCIRGKWLYSGKRGCIRVNMVVFGQSGCIRTKCLCSGKSPCNRTKVVVFGKKSLYSGNLVLFM